MDALTECYRELARAIIGQCLFDYRSALRGGMTKYIKKHEEFLRSEYGQLLLLGINGEALIEKMRREYMKG